MTENENTRRIRAFVRTFISPAIWLFAGSQVLLLVLLRIDLSAYGDNVSGLYGPLVFTVLFMGLFFLAAGIYQSFAVSQSVIQIPMALANARRIFSAFIVLSLKAGLLGLLAINVLVVFVQVFSGMEPDVLFRTYARYLSAIVAVLALVFVYWLPLVFVRGNFRLFETLGEAFRIGRSRLPQAGFLAALLLIPSFLIMILPIDTADGVVIALSVVGELLAWVAFAYCAEYLQSAAPPPAASEG
ncbi:MAG: hypothetical protein AMS22_04460 [Thiotrichales bacterium SG8_50]|nr:MAG: hypothetical protein AMS22_04460 [Thiotrichales bacterium SG8_50]